MSNVIKLTRVEAQCLEFVSQDIVYGGEYDDKLRNELQKIIDAESFNYNKPYKEVYLVLDYVGDLLKELVNSFVSDEDFVKEIGDIRPYRNLKKKLDNSTYVSYQAQIEKRFKMLALLCFELGVLTDKMEELCEKIEDKHPQVEKALDFYESKIIELCEPNDEEIFKNGDLRFDFQKIESYDVTIIISKSYEGTFSYPYGIDVEDNSYWYFNEEERDFDFNLLKLKLKTSNFKFIE